MSISFADNPKVTFALVKLEDLLVSQRANPHPDFADITSHKEVVLRRYQPIFSPTHIANITKTEFQSFLLYRNNHHWDSLHRVGKFMTQDMDLLREALVILLDENRPIQSRLNELRPERYWGEHSKVPYVGMPVLTAILQIFKPDIYSVWNNTSDAGMKIVKVWNRAWETKRAGDAYSEINELCLYFAKKLGVDLWTLDALWWVLKK